MRLACFSEQGRKEGLTPHLRLPVLNVSSQILNHFALVADADAAFSTLASHAVTGPLWLDAIGLSYSLQC